MPRLRSTERVRAQNRADGCRLWRFRLRPRRCTGCTVSVWPIHENHRFCHMNPMITWAGFLSSDRDGQGRRKGPEKWAVGGVSVFIKWRVASGEWRGKKCFGVSVFLLSSEWRVASGEEEGFGASPGIAVGTAVTGRPPHRSVREVFPHTALAASRARKRSFG